MQYGDRMQKSLLNKSKEFKEQALILGIESSCDETAAAVVSGQRTLLASCIRSQIDFHKKFGGVVPEEASRMHVEALVPVTQQALSEAGVGLNDIDAVGVTNRPGLVGALLTGVNFAKGIAFAQGLPLIGVHHIEGHISAAYLAYPLLQPPFVALVVSGGHSHLFFVQDYGSYRLLGNTVDDAAGEALDKAARMLGQPYPGGPNLEKLAREGDPERFPFSQPFNRQQDHLNFSFSGLKTALSTLVSQMPEDVREREAPHLAASFQQAVVQTLCTKALLAVRKCRVQQLVLCGGVAANHHLRTSLGTLCHREGIALFTPSMDFCTDNAAMIACAAAIRFEQGRLSDLTLNAHSVAKLDAESSCYPQK